ncbi:uncharacterized protein LOC132703940 isoform X2 [Cylas formicarius]|uniref:uncharacterized protein LOC132703940 isoform X2 n=1 Tax=Cylas formicarius TaxID=197179 RepID=UPI0029585E04|nr:uncharacterized protein LOC132703940 isoform X2 [Cylas formicarius]
MSKKAQWYTPVARLKNREQVWEIIERKGWKSEKVNTEKEISYFDAAPRYTHLLEYDRYFAFTKAFPLWDPRKPKDNRKYLPTVRENIFEQTIRTKPLFCINSRLSTCRYYVS